MAESKVALISGCSSGVGLHTAVRLGERGWTVVATMRDTAKAGALEAAARDAGVAVEIAPLDVADQGSIDAAVADAVARHGRIDLLVNNAGAGFLASVEQTSDEDLRRVMEVNFFGVWNLTRAVLPHMRAARSGRIVSVTSVGGLLGQPFNEAYCAAKFAVEGAMEGLAPLARQFGIDVCLVEPGPINTEFVATVQASSPRGLDADYAPLLANYTGGMTAMFATYGQTGDEVAQVVVAVAEAEKADLRTLTSDFARAAIAAKADPTGNAAVEMFAKRLAGAG